MAKGDYSGGSTIVGPGSGWFTHSKAKPRRQSKAAALGDALAAHCRQERADWDMSIDRRMVVSAEELKRQSKRRIPQAPRVASDVDPADSKKAKTAARQAAKRQKLGIDD